MAWYVNRGESVSGPFEEREIRQRIADGNITREHRVSEEPTGAWQPLATTIFAAAWVAPPVEVKPRKSSLGASFGRIIGLLFLISWIASALSNVVVERRKADQEKLRNDQKNEVRRLGSELRQMVVAAEGSSSLIAPLPAASNSTEVGEVGGLLKTILYRRQAIGREYAAELDATGWSKILDAERLSKDRTFLQTRTLLKQAEEILAKYRTRLADDGVQMRRDLENAHISRQALAGFQASLAQAESQQQRAWVLEEQAFAHAQAIGKLLDSKRGRWRVKAGRLEFQSRADLDLFNSHLTQARATAAQQEEIQADARRRLEETIREFEK